MPFSSFEPTAGLGVFGAKWPEPKRPPPPSEEQWVELIAGNKLQEIDKILIENSDLANTSIEGIDLHLIEMVALHPEEAVARKLMAMVASHMDNVSCPDVNGNTLLHWSYLFPDFYSEILLDHEADPHEENIQCLSCIPFMKVLKVEIPKPLHPYIPASLPYTGSKMYPEVKPFERHSEFIPNREEPVVSRRHNVTCNYRDPKQQLFSWAVGHSFRRIIWEEGRELATVRPDFREHGSSTPGEVERLIEAYAKMWGEKRFYVTDMIVPIEGTSGHWVLVIVDTEEKKILSFNSIAKGEVDFSTLASKIGYEHVKMDTEGQQQDYVNCGVYMNLYLQAYLQGTREGKSLPEMNRVFQEMVRIAKIDPEMERQRIQEYRQEVADNIAEMKWLSKKMKKQALEKYTKALGNELLAESMLKSRIQLFRSMHLPNWELEWFELYRQGYDLYDYFQVVSFASQKEGTVEEAIQKIRGIV